MTSAAVHVGCSELSCYTANLAVYLRGAQADPLDRIARTVWLAVRTDLPDDLIAFSHHRVPLSELDDGRQLGYVSAGSAEAALAGLELELTTGAALAVTYSGALPWSLVEAGHTAPHFLLITARDGDRWQVSDAFSALLPAGRQEPFSGGLTTAGLIAAMRPPPLAAEHELRLGHALGHPLPAPPAGHYAWLVRRVPTSAPVPLRGPAWITAADEALAFLGEFFAGLGGCPRRARFADDIWAGAQHHVFRYNHVMAQPTLPAADRDAVTAARDRWAELPMAVRFAVESAARGRPRPSLVRAAFEQVRRAEERAAPVLVAYGYAADPASPDPAERNSDVDEY